MSCELCASVLHGYLDGELDAARAADFERHLVSCAECVSALETQEKLRASIQTAGLYERAPVALRQKMQREFGEAARTATTYSWWGTWGWLATVATYNPVTYVLGGVRQGFVSEVTWQETWHAFAAVFGLVFLLSMLAMYGMSRVGVNE